MKGGHGAFLEQPPQQERKRSSSQGQPVVRRQSAGPQPPRTSTPHPSKPILRASRAGQEGLEGGTKDDATKPIETKLLTDPYHDLYYNRPHLSRIRISVVAADISRSWALVTYNRQYYYKLICIFQIVLQRYMIRNRAKNVMLLRGYAACDSALALVSGAKKPGITRESSVMERG
jgi:hypothetical protein